MPLTGRYRLRFVRARLGRLGTYLSLFGRSFSNGLPSRTLVRIHYSILSYSYRGITLMKSPFDLALLSLLIDRTQPRTIVEIGTLSGGSALWLADQTRIRGLDTRIYTLDVVQLSKVRDERITFLTGDVHRLDQSDLPQILAQCPRPLMVLEDGPHTREACASALEFFDGFLKPGEYIVVEDGIVRDLGFWSYRNGPNWAVRRFLSTRGDSYSIDRSLCDNFGRNVTWSPNGYLRRET